MVLWSWVLPVLSVGNKYLQPSHSKEIHYKLLLVMLSCMPGGIDQLCPCNSALLRKSKSCYGLYSLLQTKPTTLTLLCCFSAPCGQI